MAIVASTSSSTAPPLPYSSYAPLPPGDDADHLQPTKRRRACVAVLAAAGVVLLVVATGLAGRVRMDHQEVVGTTARRSRGRDAGVSEKTTSGSDGGIRLQEGSSEADGFPWSNAMLQWQRTGFHFQPQKNWMNGPVYYKGWYHLFYQYNPEGAVWGNIAWGHAVSRDLIRWQHLPLAMVPDQWYDINGVWTGSATVLPDGQLAMLYTGSTNESVQVQCLAVPSDPIGDPLLINWTKHEANPVMYPPPGVGDRDFRDPTSAWFDPSDNTWRIVIGSKDDADHAGIAIMYKTKDFVNYELMPGVLHRVPGTGMWECIDFYPINNGDDAAMMHVMKASMDDDRHDYYALGRYDAAANTWTPVDPDNDLGTIGGLRYDWGKFYASKTFYDPAKRRRVLWGWVGETDSERADVAKGWASLQSIPRTVLLDTATGSKQQLIQWPVEEVETLRTNATDLSGVTIQPGSVVPLNLHGATQLDIIAEFEIIDRHAVAAIEEDDYNCSTSGGAAGRGALGPFGLLVLADRHRHEQTAVYFYVSARDRDQQIRVHFCHDESRSSRANDIVKRVVGSVVAVDQPAEEDQLMRLSVRVLVDHSIVESFAQGGRSVVTSRVYPTEAIYAAAGVFLFNNATAGTVTATTLVVHQMLHSSSSYNHATI
ncbi:hypothetical protein EJB05_53332, partial [Eragrostis curvula]